MVAVSIVVTPEAPVDISAVSIIGEFSTLKCPHTKSCATVNKSVHILHTDQALSFCLVHRANHNVQSAAIMPICFFCYSLHNCASISSQINQVVDPITQVLNVGHNLQLEFDRYEKV